MVRFQARPLMTEDVQSLHESLKLIEQKIFVERCAVDNVSTYLRQLWRQRDNLKRKISDCGLK